MAFCKLKSNNSIKSQIIANIRKSGETPEAFIPKDINLKDWEIECDNKGEVVAQGNLYSNEGDWYSCTLQKIYVSETVRGKGYGDKIVKRLIDKAKHRKNHGFDDCQILTADISRSNQVSRNLFEKNGFTIQNSFCVPNANEKADVLRMVLSDVKGCKR